MKNFSISRNHISYTFDTNKIITKNDTNYIDIYYFRSVMCDTFKISKSLSEERPGPANRVYYTEFGPGSASFLYEDHAIDLPAFEFNGESVYKLWPSAGNSYTSADSGLSLGAISGEAGVIKVAYDDKYGGFTVDVLHALAEASANIAITEAKAGAGAEAEVVIEIVGAAGHVKIPLFWSGKDIVIRGEVSLGGIGAGAEIATNGHGVKIIYGIGGGIYFSIDDHGE